MSSCRCKEITECKNKIARLNEASENMDHYATPLVSLSNKIGDLISNVKLAYDAANMEAFVNALSDLDSDFNDARSAFQEKVGAALEELADELDVLDSDDSDYHKEEAKKNKESEDITSELSDESSSSSNT